ncbi:hypothetical protein [Synechococcus sp. PCC 7336]|uniref:hypothetical protein n=1 Tax=Synechococcus sp. PCC 7336 TaxID=195250 RepID=UPI000366A527|nr:hypothetical protein [Synechococcus sp. PCC 7336]
MYEIKWTETADKTYADLKATAKANREARKKKKIEKSTQQEGLFKQVAKTVKFLKSNPRHQGLNTHEYDSIPHPYDKDKKVFEAYVQNRTSGAYRVFWCYGPDRNQITIIAITPHL